MKLLTASCLALPLYSCNVVPAVDVMPLYGSYSVGGEIGASTGGTPAINQKLSDIGIDGSEGGFGGRASIEWLNFMLAVSGFQADYSGTGTTTADISFDDQTITVGTDVNSRLDLSYLDATLTFDVFPGDTFDIGLGLGVAALDLKLDVADTANTTQLNGDETIPLPELALRGAVNLGRFGIFGNLGWISGKYDDFDGQLLDIDLHGRVRIFGSGDRFLGHAALGYRYVDTDFEFNDGSDQVKADLDISGPYLGLNFSF